LIMLLNTSGSLNLEALLGGSNFPKYMTIAYLEFFYQFNCILTVF
jgi:hypothetical protein